jgi:hypothetical protein
MKTYRIALLLVVVIVVLSACAPRPAEPTPTVAPAAPAALKTAVGDLRVTSARLVDQANSTKASEGSKILLLGLERPDGSPIDLQQFQDARMQIFIRGDDGSNTLSTMGGFVDGAFCIGFQVPENLKTYSLEWEGNDPVEIKPE